MTWQMANSLSLMAIDLLLDLFSSDFAIVSTPSEQSIAIDCKRHPTNRFSPQSIANVIRPIIQSIDYHYLPSLPSIAQGLYTWAGVYRVFDAEKTRWRNHPRLSRYCDHWSQYCRIIIFKHIGHCSQRP